MRSFGLEFLMVFKEYLQTIRKHLRKIFLGFSIGLFNFAFFIGYMVVYSIPLSSFHSLIYSGSIKWLISCIYFLFIFEDFEIILYSLLFYIFFQTILHYSTDLIVLILIPNILYISVFFMLKNYIKKPKENIFYFFILLVNFISNLSDLFLKIIIDNFSILRKVFPLQDKISFSILQKKNLNLPLFDINRIHFRVFKSNDLSKTQNFLINTFSNGITMLDIILMILFFFNYDQWIKLGKRKLDPIFYSLTLFFFILNYSKIFLMFPIISYLISLINTSLIFLVFARGFILLDYVLFQKLSFFMRIIINRLLYQKIFYSDNFVIICFLISVIEFWFSSKGTSSDIFEE